MSGNDWHDRAAPAIEDIEAIAQAAFAALPEAFRALTGGLVFRVADFADAEALASVGLESEFDLLGLFVGIGLPQEGAVPFTGRMPNQIWLFRRPILDFWAEGDDTLGAVVTHVLVHEIGHHFGLSDEDMERIEDEAD
ncbi:Predicted Zn-dependent protease, minimal metalloprotease (MMP)-like domain [Pseudoxanthobacter soli DSM 19599]|uniref:Predicted Zn-dependent protease, minimal metalloprotease (MMP)-like domain n=1 Tax=Pseudoxanthobacter soli DSM 19599 TaxID=1123029 RepID=A0A1M7ZBX7_9HYPH|nr:metallopeptidase family protein [Pseudoxanthobacter soli]SHO62394.1 Predicted Zn-dependent protease, minimal metalloprotease (MMP)-like domain [Pseudoxanthobacter soli DSM 19599]